MFLEQNFLKKFLLVLLSCWLVTGHARPGGDTGGTLDFLAPRDREALHLTGLVPLVEARRARQWLKSCPSTSSLSAQILFCRHYEAIWQTPAEDTQQVFWPNDLQLLIFGERHTEVESRSFLIERLKLMAREGVDTLALEMFNSNAQELLDDYLKDLVELSEVKVTLKEHWNYPSKSYIELIEKAKSLGLHILALDDRPSVNGLSFSKALKTRDRHMAKKLIEHFKNRPNSKVVALTGRLHAYRTFSVNQKPQTIIELVQDQLPRIRTKSYLMLGRREKTAFTVLIDELVPDAFSKLIEAPSFLPYTNALIRL